MDGCMDVWVDEWMDVWMDWIREGCRRVLCIAVSIRVHEGRLGRVGGREGSGWVGEYRRDVRMNVMVCDDSDGMI